MTATAALKHFWSTDAFQQDIQRKGDLLARRLEQMAARHGLSVKGRGMMRGLDAGSGEMAALITSSAFDQGLIIETSGAHDEIVKILAPLVISDAAFSSGLDILENCVKRAFAHAASVAAE